MRGYIKVHIIYISQPIFFSSQYIYNIDEVKKKTAAGQTTYDPFFFSQPRSTLPTLLHAVIKNSGGAEELHNLSIYISTVLPIKKAL